MSQNRNLSAEVAATFAAIADARKAASAKPETEKASAPKSPASILAAEVSAIVGTVRRGKVTSGNVNTLVNVFATIGETGKVSPVQKSAARTLLADVRKIGTDSAATFHYPTGRALSEMATVLAVMAK